MCFLICAGVSINTGAGEAAGAVAAVAAVAPGAGAAVTALATLVLAATVPGGPVWAGVVVVAVDGSVMGHRGGEQGPSLNCSVCEQNALSCEQNAQALESPSGLGF